MSFENELREVRARTVESAREQIAKWPITSRTTLEALEERQSILRFLANLGADLRAGRS